MIGLGPYVHIFKTETLSGAVTWQVYYIGYNSDKISHIPLSLVKYSLGKKRKRTSSIFSRYWF